MNEGIALKSIAKSKAAANRAVKSLDIQQLESALANLTAAAETMKERESLRAQRKKEVAVKKLKSMMDELGISAADITGASKPKGNGKRATGPKKGNATGPKKGNKVAPKYQITVDGVTHQWTGRGRTPVVFKSHVENGGSLDDCLI